MDRIYNEIPKVIHYCWFGRKPLPELAIKCINSWKLYFPDYEIKEWNEDNFDVFSIKYTREAYESKKYAFVSDYARFWILYNYGGLYFDTDVEVIKDMDLIIMNGPFLGCEHSYIQGQDPSMLGVAPGLGIGSAPQMPLFKELIDYYSTLSFYNNDGSFNQTTIVQYTTNLLVKHGLKNTPHIQRCAGFNIYPKEYFCPIEYTTGELTVSDLTYTIHHYMASWITTRQRIYVLIKKKFGEKVAQFISRVLKKCHIVK